MNGHKTKQYQYYNTNPANIQAEILALYGRCRAKGGFGGDRRVSPQVVQETLDENPDDENSDGIINYSHLYSEERLDALRLANVHLEKWITKESVSRRHSKKKVSSEPPFLMLSKEEQLLFTDEDEFNEWISS